MRKIAYICLTMFISFLAYAGGNPEQVSFPNGYKTDFKKYDSRNRNGKQQVAVLYANKIALDSANSTKLGDGNYVKGKFAAVAMMEKRSDWEGSIDANERTGDWGYAIYHTNGKPKDNELDCAGCHRPIAENDFLFSHSSLVEFAK